MKESNAPSTIALIERWVKNAFNFITIKTPLSSSHPARRIIIENLYWNKQLRKDGIKIFHSPISYLPYNLDIPSIITIHDLRVFRNPETYTKMRRYFLNNSIKNSIKKAEKIITISEFTKSEIVDIFKTPSEKISVIHEGINVAKFKTDKQKSDIYILKKYAICKPYIFTVGHLEPRKNFLRLIKAYEILDEILNNCFLILIKYEQFSCLRR